MNYDIRHSATKSSVQILRSLTSWRCPHALLCAVQQAIDISCSCGTDGRTDGETDRQTPDRCIDPAALRILCEQCQKQNEVNYTDSAVSEHVTL